jgi:rod shape-determining protein MreD
VIAPADTDGVMARLRRRAAAVPILSTLAGSATVLLPVVAPVPLLPPFGLLVLLGWRLLRPELWPAWVGLPLGLADDLLAGRPLGTAAVAWTLVLTLIDATEDRSPWRGRIEEWLIAALACGTVTLWDWFIARVTGGGGPLRVTTPMLLASILVFPLVQRGCARLDRWRLRA